jgi:RNA polymerase sigma-70 factor (ECF subfamily)
MQTGLFDRLYAEHAESLLAFLVYRTGDRALAEDVHADTFERVLRGRAPFDPRKGGEKTWLYAIALNLVRDHARRRAAEDRAVQRVAAGLDPSTRSPEERLGEHDAVLGALAGLSDEEREAVALRYGADLSLREIARLLGTPTTTVKGRLHRALTKLREQLGDAPS